MFKIRLNKLIILAAFLSCFLFGKNAFAANYYVDSSLGDDANVGTDSTQPWKTIEKINTSNFLAGDNILFKKGSVWNGETLTVPNSGAAGNPISFGAYGSGSDPILDGGGTQNFGIYAGGKSYLNITALTFRNFTANNAYCIGLSDLAHHIDMSDVTLMDSYGGVGLWNGPHDISISNIDISGMNYSGIFWYNTGSSDVYNIEIKNFNLHDFNPLYAFYHGISFYWGVGGVTGKPYNITIKDGSIYNLKGTGQINAGILLTSEDYRITGHSVTIDNLDIYEVDGGGISFGNIDDSGQTKSVIKNSRVHDNSYKAPIGGVWIAGCVGLVVEDNTIYNNHTNTRWEGNGLYFDWGGGTGSTVSHDCIARRNTIYGHDDIHNFSPLGSDYGANSTGIAFTQGVYDIDVYQNIVYGNTEGISAYYDKSPSESHPPGLDSPHDLNIYNNVVADNVVGIAKAGSGENIKLRNNIVAFNASYGIVNTILWNDTSTPIDNDYNAVHSNGTNFVNVTEGSHSVTGDPLFKNRGNHDYHLGGSSPCINVGESTSLFTTDYDGESIVGQVDMGAFEYQGLVSSTKSITTFTIPSQIGSTTINQSAHTIALTMPHGTATTALVASFTATGTSVSVNGIVQISGTTPNDFTDPLTYLVTAADASTQAYVVTVTVAPNPSSLKAITAFTVPGQVGATSISESARTISLTMPVGTDVTVLVPTITITGTSVSPASGVAQNFTNPVNYTVTAADASTQVYVITVTVASAPSPTSKDITSFSFDNLNPAVHGTIDNGAQTITITVPFGTDVTALVPTIIHSGASVSPASGVARDFTLPVTYTVTAQDNSTKAYVVSVNISTSPTPTPTPTPAPDTEDYFDDLKLVFSEKDVKHEKTSKKEVTLKFKNISGIKRYKVSHFSHFEKADWNKMEKDIELKISQKERDEQQFFFKFKDKNGNTSDTYKKEVTFEPAPYSIFNLPKRGHKGEIMHQSGEKFSPNSDVALYFSGAWGGYYAPVQVKTDASGNFLVDYKIRKIAGWYNWYAVDLKTGTKTGTISYLIF
ncbi:MAG: choice-of-anchor Q domain-containing protein [Candidatus Moraniibacteriota bacterium]